MTAACHWHRPRPASVVGCGGGRASFYWHLGRSSHGRGPAAALQGMDSLNLWIYRDANRAVIYAYVWVNDRRQYSRHHRHGLTADEFHQHVSVSH